MPTPTTTTGATMGSALKLRADAIRTGHVIVSMWGSRLRCLEVAVVRHEMFERPEQPGVRVPVVRFDGWDSLCGQWWMPTIERPWVERGWGQRPDGLVYVIGDARETQQRAYRTVVCV